MKNLSIFRQAIFAFTLFLLLFPFLYSVPRTLAQSTETLAVYKTLPIKVNASYVAALGSTLFGMRGRVYDLGVRFWLNDSNRILEVQKASGAIWYGDMSKLYNESYVPRLPSNNTAQQVANTFLSKNNLMPSEASFRDIGNTIIVKEQMNGTQTHRINDMQVIYNFRLGNMLVDGPGAKVKVILGDGGAIIGLVWAWRSLSPQPVGNFQVISESQILQACQRFVGGINPQISTSLVYYASSGVLDQTYLQPYYECSGSSSVMTESGARVTFPFRTLNIPATTFSPQVTITSPSDRSVFQQGASVQFNATVVGGTPPYTYLWHSYGVPVIGTVPSFTFTPNPESRDSVSTPYGIILTVTDANGQVGTDMITINVTPRTTPTFTPIILLLIAVGLFFLVLLLRRRKHARQLTAILLILLVFSALSTNAFAFTYGIEWIGTEVACDVDSAGFSNGISSVPGWSNSFYWGEPVAWESDFKFEGAGEGGGHAHSWVDTVNFQWYCGHANGDGFAFRTDRQDRFLEYHDAGQGKWTNDANGWGSTLKWIIIAACGPLQYTTGNGDVFDRWGPAMKGLHWILAYSSESNAATTEGSGFIDYAASRFLGIPFAGYRIQVAWIKAAEDAQPSSVTIATLYAGSGGADPYYDYLPGPIGAHWSADPLPAQFMGWMETPA